MYRKMFSLKQDIQEQNWKREDWWKEATKQGVTASSSSSHSSMCALVVNSVFKEHWVVLHCAVNGWNQVP